MKLLNLNSNYYYYNLVEACINTLKLVREKFYLMRKSEKKTLGKTYTAKIQKMNGSE